MCGLRNDSPVAADSVRGRVAADDLELPALVSTGVTGPYPSLLLLVILTLQNGLPECETPNSIRAYDLGRIELELL